jgi:hypothetical protein
LPITFAGTSAERSRVVASKNVFIKQLGRTLTSGCLLGVVAIALCVGADGEKASGACASMNPMSGPYLACVRAEIEAAERTKPLEQALLEDPLRSDLQALNRSLDYQGSEDDLAELKRRSTDLKRDPRLHRHAIALLDAAIASSHGELGPAISTKQLATSATTGTNIYKPFIQQKLAFLGSSKAKFYDRGPYEITARSLLANTIEANYFLERQAGNRDDAKLQKEISVLDEVNARLTDPQFDYIDVPQRASRVNSNKFWRASLLFALGNKAELRDRLQDLILTTKHFELESDQNPGQVFIYRAFDLPTEMIVRQRDSAADGDPTIDMREPDLVRRFFNPAQLGLVACSLLNKAGSDNGIATFTKVIGDLVFSDYYVVGASADSAEKLRQFDSAVQTAISSPGFSSQRQRIVETIRGQEVVGFYDAIKVGAQSCGIDDSVRDEIFSPFQLRSESRHIEGRGERSEILTFGGRLNGNQAATLSNFLVSSIFTLPEIQAARAAGNIDTAAYVARMRVDQ